MTLDDAHSILVRSSPLDVGRFYQSGETVALGVGKIFEGIRFPLFNEIDGVFDTVEGLVFVLTHECDIDPANRRPFNEYLIFCPIIPLNVFLQDYLKVNSCEADLKSFLANTAERKVTRITYLPPADGPLSYGGFMYLNQISSTHVSNFTEAAAKALCSVTSYGLVNVDRCLTNHLLRPKAEHLATY